MVQKIKPGDIVRYHGKMVRVMKCDPGDPDFQFKLSNFGWIHNHSLSNLELVNSAPDTILKDGDEVIIRDIPEDEKIHMVLLGWVLWIRLQYRVKFTLSQTFIIVIDMVGLDILVRMTFNYIMLNPLTIST